MSLIRFAEFSADPRTEELWRDGRRVRLPRQSFQILVALTRSPGELVTRESLQAALWPATSQVEWEQGLNAAVNRLREALGDSAAQPRFIETLPRRGYRFIGTLEAETSAPAPTLAEPASSAKPRGPRFEWTPVLAIAAIGGVLLAAHWVLDRGASKPSPLANARLSPFTALAGEERAPAFSPEGTRIAFAWNGGDGQPGFDLYVKARNSETLLRLTQTPARALSPAWSPDGASIAFMRQLEGHDGVYLVPALGGPERRLAAAAPADPPFEQVAWSPDGRTLAYSSYESGKHLLWLLDVATLSSRPLPHAPDCWHTGLPAFSADGRRIAYVCTTSVGVYGIFVSQLDGDHAMKRATVMGEPRGLAWDADDVSLIVANDAGDGGALWLLETTGSWTRLPFGEEGMTPARAKSGDLAYARARQAIEIWRMDLAAADPAASARRLVASTRAELTPRYSPDLAHIAFQSNRTGTTEIWMTDADGANPVRLTQFDGPLTGAPTWCADNRRVAFDSRASGDAGIYVVDIDSRQPRRLGDVDAKLSLPAWSSDCRTIIGSNGRSRLFKLPVEGGAAVPFTGQPAYLAQVVGDRAVFNVMQPAGVTLWQKPVAGGDEVALAGMPQLGYNDAWAVSDAGIYFTRSAHGAVTLEFYDFESRAVRRVASLPKNPEPGGGLGIAVSHDGRWLLYGQAGEAQSDIMLAQPR